MANTKKTPERTPAADERTENADRPVTELAHVDANTSTETMKQMAGVSDTQYRPDEKSESEASDQQKDAFEGLKQAKAQAKHPEKKPEVNPFTTGPGGMIG